MRERWAWTVAAAALLAAAVFAAVALRGPRDRGRPIRLSLEQPAKAPFEFFDHPTVSPDGRNVAFIAHGAGGKQSIWIRPLDSLSARPLAGTDGVTGLFWSPNSGSIGFFADGKLKRIESAGGAPQALADASTPHGGAWNADGVILFAPTAYSPLRRVPAAGGAVSDVTKLGPREDGHMWPAFLPDGRHFVFLADASTTPDHSIRLGALDSPETEKLLSPAVTNLAFAPPDRILFVRAGSLVAQRLDVSKRRLVGDPETLGEQIALGDLQHGFDFSVSQTGTLVYRSASPETQLAWFDRSGKRLAAIGEPARYGRIEISPDEKQLACERLDADLRHGNLWLVDLSRGSTSRLTAGATSDYAPVWSPDGRRILYGSARTGVADLYEIASGGGSSEKLVLHDSLDKNPMSWSPDGRFALISIIGPNTREDILVLPLSGTGKMAPLVSTDFTEFDAQVSPDGRWFADSSDESGRLEIYVQSFSDTTQRYRVSTSGGIRARWRGDGKELFFVADNVVRSVAISGGAAFEAGPPKDLFRIVGLADYAVTRDGQRILAAASVDQAPDLPATVVLNWEPVK